MDKIKRVLIVGGTHGNELTGIYLVKKFEQRPKLIHRASFESSTLFANPEAFKIGKRYVETDLNRCFRVEDLANPSLSSYEAQRAKVIFQEFGVGGNQAADVVLDLHTTTSNMGLTIILGDKNLFNFRLAAYLVSINPQVKILYSVVPSQNRPHLDSMCPFGFTIEVGAVAQNVLDASLFQQTEELVYAILDYLDAYNQGNAFTGGDTLKMYQVIENIDYPRNELGEIKAMVHPSLQFQDYEALQPGKPMFLTFEGEEILYQGDSVVYPVFINEAAYYEKGVAMCFTEVLCEKLN